MNRRTLPQGSRAQRAEFQQQHGSHRREGSRLAAALTLGKLVMCCSSNTAVNAFVSPATSAVSKGVARYQTQQQQHQHRDHQRTGFPSGVLQNCNRMNLQQRYMDENPQVGVSTSTTEAAPARAT